MKKRSSDEDISLLYGKRLKLDADSSDSSLNSHPGNEEEDDEVSRRFACKRVCAVCEPLFIDSLQEVDKHFKKLINKHKLAVKEDLERLFEWKNNDTKWCTTCEPMLNYEIKKIQSQYHQLIDDNFWVLAKKSSKIHNTNFYNRYNLKINKRW